MNSFQDCVNKINLLKQSNPDITISDENKLALYKYYKQGCGISLGNPPGMFQFVEKKKWESHKSVSHMTQSEAQQQYISIVQDVLSECINT
jgi:acyl-CoA-binding protein